MATLVLQTLGATVGTALGGPIAGAIGSALGASAGSAIDQRLFGPGDRSLQGPRLDAVALLTCASTAQQYRLQAPLPATRIGQLQAEDQGSRVQAKEEGLHCHTE